MELREGFTREEEVLCVLAHEMTHAFLGMYSCKCLDCRKERSYSRDGKADDGHGPRWADAAAAVQASLAKDVSWKVDLGVCACVSKSTLRNDWIVQYEVAKNWLERGELVRVSQKV